MVAGDGGREAKVESSSLLVEDSKSTLVQAEDTQSTTQKLTEDVKVYFKTFDRYKAEPLLEKHGKRFEIKHAEDGKSGNMSAEPKFHLWHTYKEELHDHFEIWGGRKFGYAHARDAPHLMFEATRVKGVFEKVPWKLRGVFWMDGLNNPEVLATWQYGQWYDEEGVLVTPKSPWYWGYWGGEFRGPAKSGCGGWLEKYYSILWGLCPLQTPEYERSSGRQIADWYTSGQEEMWVFKVHSGLSSWGLLQAHLQLYYDGDLSKVESTGIPADYTFTEIPGSFGTKFMRGVYFACGTLPPWPWGYTAKKIIDEDGEKVQPYFDEFLEFMGDTKVILNYESPGW